jgi:hypothetical protein
MMPEADWFSDLLPTSISYRAETCELAPMKKSLKAHRLWPSDRLASARVA